MHGNDKHQIEGSFYTLGGRGKRHFPRTNFLKGLLKHKSECDVLALWRAAYH